MGVRHTLAKLLIPKLYQTGFASAYDTPRPSILYLARQNRKELVGAEIGVGDGSNAESILSLLDIKTLYLVDPYVPYVVDEQFWSYESYKEATMSKMTKFGDKVEFIVRDACDAAGYMAGPLDFVYIDSNHQYEHVKDDLVTYYWMLKGDGLLCGHDFWSDYPGVIRAVSEFSVHNHLKLLVERRDWWLLSS
jgi:hypothetical protein